MAEYTKNLKLFKYDPITDAKQVFSIDQALNYNWDILDEKASGGGLEIGDIGIAALGIDESKGLRRYLNGSILTANTNTQGFINKLKSAAALYPSLVCTETEWQAIASTSVGGQCGKFVINYDTGGTIVVSVRLPKIIMPIQGLTDLSKLSELVEAALPNITGQINGVSETFGEYTSSISGSFYKVSQTPVLNGTPTNIDSTNTGTLAFDASRSNPIYGKTDTVQQEQIQYPYFIQIATGVEYEVNITNDIELNNPFTLFDSKYSEVPLYNLAWLLSNGTYYAKSVYVTAYEALLVENNSQITAGTSSQLPSGGTYIKRGLPVKLSTVEDITDYDFVINTTDETFRLPLKSKLASGSAVAGNGLSLGITDGTDKYGARNGTDGENSYIAAVANAYGVNAGTTLGASVALAGPVSLGITEDETKSGIETSTNGLSLYFYVGETVQNANLINAAEIPNTRAEINLSNVTSAGKEAAVGWCMPDYSRAVDIASLSSYTCPSNGWLFLQCVNPMRGEGYVSYNSSISPLRYYISTYTAGILTQTALFPVAKGEILTKANSNGTVSARFIPMKGADANA